MARPGRFQRENEIIDTPLEIVAGKGAASWRVAVLPIFQSDEQNVNSPLVSREQTRRIQQLLKNLIERGKTNAARQLKFLQPELKGFLERFGGESCGHRYRVLLLASTQSRLGLECGCELDLSQVRLVSQSQLLNGSPKGAQQLCDCFVFK